MIGRIIFAFFAVLNGSTLWAECTQTHVVKDGDTVFRSPSNILAIIKNGR